MGIALPLGVFLGGAVASAFGLSAAFVLALAICVLLSVGTATPLKQAA